jgi:hypothetical protein
MQQAHKKLAGVAGKSSGGKLAENGVIEVRDDEHEASGLASSRPSKALSRDQEKLGVSIRSDPG